MAFKRCMGLKANAEQCADCARLPQTPQEENETPDDCWIKLVQTPCKNWAPIEPRG